MARESRLETFIHRIAAHRACLNYAALLVRDLPGPVLEVGLGNGRTYDHLRVLFPAREIFVFDREIAAHPDCIPDAAHALLGDFRETLPGALARIGKPAALIHGDFGSGDRERTAQLAAWIGPHLAALARPGAVLVTDQPIAAPELEPIALPATVKPGRYHMWRRR